MLKIVMWLQVIFLIVGLALLVKGGELFVSAAVRIAELSRIPRVVVGSTLVSLATTTPELVVSIMAGAKGESGLAIGKLSNKTKDRGLSGFAAKGEA